MLGAVWIWASLSKLSSPRTFVQAVRAYDATPEWLSKGIGYGLPVLELALGLLLVIGIAVRISAVVSAVLLVIFTIGILQAAARGIQLDCGCFGGGGTTAGGTTYFLDVLRDLALLALAAYLIVRPLTRLSVESYLARHDYVAPPSAKRMRSDQGRKKYNAMLEARRREARSRDRYITGSLAGVIVLVVLIGIGVQAGRAKIAGSLTATNASASGVVFGKKAAATVDVYEDFQCPNCLNFEKAVGKTLDADVRANKAQVRFHPMSFLDASSSGNRYSSRAANAALCASDVSVDAFVAYHNLLYSTVGGKQVQPREGSNGRADTQLIGYARQAKIPTKQLASFTTCVTSEQHKALVQAITERASQAGVNGTPTVKVNGKSIGASLKAFDAAVASALTKGPAPSPSVTPTSSPAPSSSAAPGTPSPSPSKAATAKASPAPSPAPTATPTKTG